MPMSEEIKTFKVTLSATSESADRVKSRLKKFYRRRAEHVEEQEPDHLKIRMRNGSEVYCTLKKHSKAKWSSTEPIAELMVTSTRFYLDYSVVSAQRYAKRSDTYLKIEVEEQKPKMSGLGSKPADQP